ncbi:MAG: hypothetical protein FWF53_09165 [Candidatus Azobacteroides sp.]|nr:hypothetical protein [Candidatus Azobacteroides sp.]
MKIDKNTTLEDFIFYTDLFKSDEKQIEDLFSKLELTELPPYILNKPIPENLNDLTFGQLIKIQSIKTVKDMLLVPLHVISGIDIEKILTCKAFDVIRFMLFVQKELTRIGKLFAEIKYRPSAEEVQAGINNIDNGVFGTIDWYARRMGITDHSEVESIPWIRIYKCLEMDNRQALFEKKLREIYSKKK